MVPADDRRGLPGFVRAVFLGEDQGQHGLHKKIEGGSENFFGDSRRGQYGAQCPFGTRQIMVLEQKEGLI